MIIKNIFRIAGVLVLLILYSAAGYGQCEFDEVILVSPTNDYAADDTDVVSASSSVIASNKVLSGSAIIYTSDGIIRLEDGFIAENGSDFWAKIGCIVDATEESEFGNHLSVYPNPVTEQLQIEYSLVENREMAIVLVNALGQTVRQLLPLERQGAGDHQFRFSIATLPPGIYFLHFNYLDGQYAVRVIKQ